MAHAPIGFSPLILGPHLEISDLTREALRGEDCFPEKLLLLVHSLPVLSSQEQHCLPALVSLVGTEAAGLVFKAVFMVGLTTLYLVLTRSSGFTEYPIPHKL